MKTGRRLAHILVAAAATASAGASAEQMSLSCRYNGRLYSEGALICVQKSLMLNCESDAVHAAWKPVTDQAMANRCLAPSISAYTPPAPRHRHRLAAARYPLNTAIGNSRCFDFAGKRYCE